MWTYVATVESESEPGKHYDIKRADSGRLGCDCPRYRFKRGDKTCKHLEAFLHGEGQAVFTAAHGNELLAQARSIRGRVRIVTPTETFLVTRRAISFGPIR